MWRNFSWKKFLNADITFELIDLIHLGARFLIFQNIIMTIILLWEVLLINGWSIVVLFFVFFTDDFWGKDKLCFPLVGDVSLIRKGWTETWGGFYCVYCLRCFFIQFLLPRLEWLESSRFFKKFCLIFGMLLFHKFENWRYHSKDAEKKSCPK